MSETLILKGGLLIDGNGGDPVSDPEIVIEVLHLTDLVKFAKWKPTVSDHERMVQRSIAFVEHTLPTEPEANEIQTS